MFSILRHIMCFAFSRHPRPASSVLGDLEKGWSWGNGRQRARCVFYGEPDNVKECFKMHRQMETQFRLFHDILKKTTLPTRHVSFLQ